MWPMSNNDRIHIKKLLNSLVFIHVFIKFFSIVDYPQGFSDAKIARWVIRNGRLAGAAAASQLLIARLVVFASEERSLSIIRL